MNLDNHIEGDFDPLNPMNRNEEESKFKYECIDDALFRGDIDEALKLVSDTRNQVGQLRELCKQTNRDGNKEFLIKRLTKIYNQL